jgi:ACT domain-containing protein
MLQVHARTDTEAGRIDKILQHIRNTLESIEKDINALRNSIKADTVAKQATGQTVEEEYISKPAYYRYKRHVAIFKEKIEHLYKNIDNDLEQGRYVYRRLLKNYQRIVP